MDDLLYQMTRFNARTKLVITILLPRRPACDNIQKSPLQRGLATESFATQPAGKFFVLPPKSLVPIFSGKAKLI